MCIHSQLERLKTEGEVDIFKYLKTARTRRMGLLSDLVRIISPLFAIIVAILHRIIMCFVMKS